MSSAFYVARNVSPTSTKYVLNRRFQRLVHVCRRARNHSKASKVSGHLRAAVGHIFERAREGCCPGVAQTWEIDAISDRRLIIDHLPKSLSPAPKARARKSGHYLGHRDPSTTPASADAGLRDFGDSPSPIRNWLEERTGAAALQKRVILGSSASDAGIR